MGTYRDAEGNEREFEIGEDGDVYRADPEPEIPEMIVELPRIPTLQNIPGMEEIMRPANELLARAEQLTNEALTRSQQILDDANARIEQQQREMEERMRRMGFD